MKYLFVCFLFFVFSPSIFGQHDCSELEVMKLKSLIKVNAEMKVIPFYESGLYGLKMQSTDSVIIQAKYISIISNLNDTNFIIQSKENLVGVINLKEELIAPYIKGLYVFNNFDTLINYGGLIANPLCINNKWDPAYYFINKNGECIVSNYYPCPPGVTIEKKEISRSLELIQLAEKYKKTDIKKAISYCKQAILSDTLNPASYYWAVKLFMHPNDLNLSKKSCSEYSEYFLWIQESINKGISLEKNAFHLSQFNELKKSFYKTCIIDKEKAKQANKEMKRYRKIWKQNIKRV